jgi:oxygen-independent coproporphyrinogen-3 oxidase
MKTIFNKGLIEKYDKPGPRYTSYPPDRPKIFV